MIGGSAPSDYLAKLQQHPQVQLDDGPMDAILATHFIDAASLRGNEFSAFYEKRKSALVGLVERAMDKAALAEPAGESMAAAGALEDDAYGG
jgi:hypothetical protein